MGASALAMTRLALFPHLQQEAMGPMAAPHFGIALIVVMWWVMMIAMMMPSAAPFVLLYARVLRHAGASGSTAMHRRVSRRRLPCRVAWVLGGCGGRSAASGTGRAHLAEHAVVQERPAVGGGARRGGMYQLSPLKGACLRQCRGPMGFLTRHWRPGWFGALRMGLRNGAYCVGCCWILMALLFVGGVMNVAWIAALTVLVLVEKVAPAGEAIGRIAGVVLLLWAGATLVV